jgi:hypothetical protein
MRDQRPMSEAAIEALAQGGTAIRSRCSGRTPKASTGWFAQSYRGRGR